MKKFWKALGIAALAAAAVPVHIKKDEETRKKTYRSLLLSVDVGPGEDGEGTAIGVNFEDGVLTGVIAELMAAQKEAELFADDELNADMLQEIADETQEDAETLADDDDELDSEF